MYHPLTTDLQEKYLLDTFEVLDLNKIIKLLSIGATHAGVEVVDNTASAQRQRVSLSFFML